MKQFISFVKKEFYHIFRDPKTMVILLVMPVVQIIIFGFALTNEVKNTKVAVLDLSKDELSQQVINRINASNYFDVTTDLSQYSEVEKEFKEGHVKLAIIFPQHFAQDVSHFNSTQLQLLADASDPNLANTVVSYASAIINDFRNELNENKKLPYSINSEVKMLYNPQLKGAYSFVPGVMAMVLMLVCTMMTAITIVKEKETGTMEILLVSPMKPLRIIIAKAIPYLFLSVINIGTILLLSVFVLGVPINGNLFLLIFESVLFTLTCLALGLLISAGTNSQQTAMFISLVGLFLPTIMFSGVMFPVENMPLPLRFISNLVPSKWFLIIVKAVMIQGLGLKVIWKETLILSAMMVFFLALAFKKFKIRLE